MKFLGLGEATAMVRSLRDPVAREDIRNLDAPLSKEIEMRIRMSMLYALPLAAATGLALAAASFNDLDKDKDGYVSKVEARQDRSVEAGFTAADKNRDGRLDRAEFAALAAGVTKQGMDAGSPAPTTPSKYSERRRGASGAGRA